MRERDLFILIAIIVNIGDIFIRFVWASEMFDHVTLSTVIIIIPLYDNVYIICAYVVLKKSVIGVLIVTKLKKKKM